MNSDFAIHLLEISIVMVFFANKVLILIGKRFAWLFGIIAASLAIIYFSSRGNLPLASLQVGILAAAVYGFLKPTKKYIFELPIRLIIIAVVIAIAVFVLNGSLELPKSIVSVGILLGNYFLARSNFHIGWLLLGLSNAVTAYFGYLKGHVFFADFQMATAVVAFVGLISRKMRD
ncbi:MAG: nicotinamide mononucleotide transporter [Bacteroidota bacterium]